MKADELNALLQRSGLSMTASTERLAEQVGVPLRTVYRWRAGKHVVSARYEPAVRKALATTQVRKSRVSTVSRKAKNIKK